MNVSVVIPSRYRTAKLKRAIASILGTAANPKEIEFILRLHDDDQAMMKEVPALTKMGNVHTVIGKNRGYDGDAFYFMEMASRAQGIWLWGFNDDCVVLPKSSEWDTRLMEQPRTGVIVQPTHYFLNTSYYRKDETCPFCILPNGWWKQFGITEFVPPTDHFTFGILRRRERWKTVFLPGLAVWHDRQPDALMREEGRS